MKNQTYVENDRVAQIPVANNKSHKTTPGLAQQHVQREKACDKPKEGPGPESMPVKKHADRLDWDTVAIWLFIISLIVISLLTAYQFRAKLSLDSP